MKLNDRQVFALRWLAEYAPAPIDSLGHNARTTGGYAHGLGAAMLEEGIIDHYPNKRHGYSQGAANTLVSLKRLGFARNSTPGGEAFQSVRWGITIEGIHALDKIDARLALEEARSNREES